MNDAGHGVGAVESAFGAMDDFHFVDVVESQVGKKEVAAGKIDGSAVDEDFGEARIATVDEDGGKTADGAGTGEANAGLRGEEIGERNGLALLDFLTANEIDGCGGVFEIKGLGVGGDDDIFGNTLNFETKVERVVFGAAEIEDDVTSDKRWMLEMNVVAARRNDQRICAVGTRIRRPDASAWAAVELSGDFDIADAIAGKIREASGKLGVG